MTPDRPLVIISQGADGLTAQTPGDLDLTDAVHLVCALVLNLEHSCGVDAGGLLAAAQEVLPALRKLAKPPVFMQRGV